MFKAVIKHVTSNLFVRFQCELRNLSIESIVIIPFSLSASHLYAFAGLKDFCSERTYLMISTCLSSEAKVKRKRPKAFDLLTFIAVKVNLNFNG